MKKALITGITGQDGSYLVELLLSKGYEVHGLVRRSSSFNTGRIDHILLDPHDPEAKIFLHYGDLSDSEQLSSIMYNIRPIEIYHLGAQSHVRVSFDTPEYTGNVTGLGTTRILEAARRSNNEVKFYQASSSELYGSATPPQNEETHFQPRSPYACAKLYAYWMTKNYRDGYQMFACNGILFNHESERRGKTFVTRKITVGASKILLGLQDVLLMGNLDSRRDWGYAPEYVEGMWRIMQARDPEDYVLATNETHTVKEFIEETFRVLGEQITWEGSGIDEKGILKSTGKTVVAIDPRYFRPTEVDLLIGDYSKARKNLGWEPKTRFTDLVRIMAKADFEKIRNRQD